MRHLVRTAALAGPTLALLATIATTGLSRAYPGDVFVAGSPAKGPATQKPVEIAAGAWNVSPQTGAATYTFSLPLPPGRGGMSPSSLALTYNSQSPLRGGIASGWTLTGVPSIEVDTSAGILGGTFYQSGLAGGQRLIRVDEPGAEPGIKTYRAESDSDFVRYEKRADPNSGISYWRALHPNGTIFEFGTYPNAREPFNSDTPARWMLTRATDAFGNYIAYEIRPWCADPQACVQRDLYVQRIHYGGNTAAGLPDHVNIEMVYDNSISTPCPGSEIPIGAAFTYRNGVRSYRGAATLRQILIQSRASGSDAFVTRRAITLDYDAAARSCTQPRAPLRLLSAIRQTVWTAEQASTPGSPGTGLPLISFGYGTAGRTLEKTQDPGALGYFESLSESSRHLVPDPGVNPVTAETGQPGAVSMLRDVDGDGFIDFLALNDRSEQSCELTTTYNTAGQWTSSVAASWPRRPWEDGDSTPNDNLRREFCNLAYQLDRRTIQPDDPDQICPSMTANYNSYHLIDIDGDQIPELVSALDFKPGSYDPAQDGSPSEPACGTSTAACLEAVDSTDRTPCAINPHWILPTADNDPQPGEQGGCGCAFDGCPNPSCINNEGGCSDPNQQCGDCYDCSNELAGDASSYRFEWDESGIARWKNSYLSGRIGNEQLDGILRGYHPGCRYYPEGTCQGRFLWRVSHYDPATRAWGAPQQRVAPVPLESLRGTGSAGEGETMGSFQGLIDIDGDRCVDALYVAPRFLPEGITDHIQVFRGGCDDHFYGKPSLGGAPDEYGAPFLWKLPPEADSLSYSMAGSWPTTPGDTPRERAMSIVRTLRDINGDGLPDYVVGGATFPGTQSNGVSVYFNTGSGFEQTATVLAPGVDDGVDPEDLVHSISAERQVLTGPDPVYHDVYVGWSASTLREFDIDSDGLTDIAQLPAPRWDYENFNPWNPTIYPPSLAQTVWMHINVGDRFIRVPASPQTNQWWTGLAHITVFNRDRTYVRTDVADFNGDGLPDLVGEEPNACNGDDPTGCNSNGMVYRDSRDVTGQGLRLLRTIENGDGATIDFEYGSSADRIGINGEEPLVVTNDGRMPSPMWLVRRMTVTPTSGAEPSVWDYRYLKPIFNEDHHGQWAFRGFGSVKTWEPVNESDLRRLVHRRYSYAVDYSGRPFQTAVWDGDHVKTVEQTIWARGSLFGDLVESFHPIITRKYTCSSGGDLTEEDCTASGLLERTTRRFVSVTPDSLSYSGISADADLPSTGGVHPAQGSPTIMYVQRGERLTNSAGPSATSGLECVAEDRGWVFGETLLYTANRYELLPTDVRKVKATSSMWAGYDLWGRTQTVYDSLGQPQASRVWRSESELAETTRTFDNSTGNVLTVTEPSGLLTSTTYDALKLFPATVTPTLSGANPPNLAVTYTHDVHTGQVTRQQGPAQPGHSTLPVVETDYDGEGRPTRVRRSFDSGNQYVTDTVKTLAYFDHLGDPLPHRVHVEELVNRTAQTWIRRDATPDGLGRPLSESVQLATGTATTSYSYDPAGNLFSVSVPNPTGSGQAVYSYDFDALGRVTLAEQPGTPGTWSFEYDGARVIRSQKDGQGSITSTAILDSDAFGRLSFVTELRPGEIVPQAIWSYTYDPNDNMKRIVDADQISTTMTNDFVGHRKTVKRTDTGGTDRTWQYDYDLAGNLVAEIMPFDGTFTVAEFTSTWAYDQLGRVTSHRTASRGATDTSRYFPARSGPGDLFTYYDYDQAGHGSGVGRLTHVDLPFALVDYQYTVEGWVTNENRAFTIRPAGVALSDTRSYNVTYNALGQPLRVEHADANGQPGDAGAATVTRTTYDERGLPLYVNRLVDVNNTTTTTLLAKVVRNTAGLPTTRFSDFNQGQAWTYDPLGRVTSHGIRSCTAAPVAPTVSRTCAESGTTVGGETIAYYDSGDVESIEDPFSGAKVNYTFDSQHQLVNATTSIGDPFYEADLSYTLAGRVETARVTSAGPGVAQRNVRHDYSPGSQNQGPADPHAVRRLVDRTSLNTLGVLDYDPTGNLVHKTWNPPPGQGGAPQDHDFIYDGDNQLREAIKHNQPQQNDTSEVYFYDHTGQRMLAYSTADGATPARLRLWFGQTEIEYSVATTPIQQTKTEVFASLGAMPVARIRRGTTTSPTNAELNLLYSGVLGSLLTVVGTPTTPDPANHALLARYSYGPFGELLADAGAEQNDFHRLFNGKEHDELTSLSYYGARYYDRLTLTWTQSDPLTRFAPDLAWDEPRRASLYTFSLNNPLKYYDPDGRSPDCGSGSTDSECQPKESEEAKRVREKNEEQREKDREAPKTVAKVTNALTEEMKAIIRRAVRNKPASELTIQERYEATVEWKGWRETLMLASVFAGGTTASSSVPGMPAGETTAVGEGAGAGAEDVVYHYTSKKAADSIARTGLWRDSSATTVGTLSGQEAIELLGLKQLPEVVVTIRNAGQFVLNKPPIVQPHALGSGGSVDLVNPQRVGPECVTCVTPVKP